MMCATLRRSLGAVALAASANLVGGCASTHRFVFDAGPAAALRIERVVANDGRVLRFDSAGGRYDPSAQSIQGTLADGEAAALPLAEVRRLWMRGFDGKRQGAFWGNPHAWIEGADWRPDGKPQRVVLRSGEVVELKKTPAEIDAAARLIRYVPVGGPAVEIPFDELAFVQVKDTHPGRTVLLVVGVALLGVAIGVGIALGEGMSFGPS